MNDSWLIWLENSAVGAWIAESPVAYGSVLSLHAVGMAIVVGTVLMISFRMVGFARGVPMSLFRNLATVTWVGVVLNIASGIALFIGNAEKFYYMPLFWIKLSLITLGTITIMVALKMPLEQAEAAGSDAPLPLRSKVIGYLSILFWIATIAAGRYMGYIDEMSL